MIHVEEKDLRFYISESTQNGAGLGLFASEDIKKGEDLEIIGVEVDVGSPADLCTSYANSFKFAADGSESHKRHLVPVGYGGMANHANEKNDQNVEIKHIKDPKGNKVVYRFIKDVAKGEEILGDYGEGWKSLMSWTKETIVNSSKDDMEEWVSFLEKDLYNLGKLKRYKEKDAEH